MGSDSAALKRAKAEMRQNCAELCYYYPQYKLEEVLSDDMPIGDIELLLTVARKLYYEDKLDTLYVMTGAQSKKGFATVKKNLTNLIKKLKAAI